MSTNDPLSGGEIPFSYAERPLVIKLFHSTRCSWCRKFYTFPFLCPFNQPQSNCTLFNLLNNDERDKFLSDTKWSSIIEDQMRHLQKEGIIARCRKCKALNPNPKSTTCWKCGESLICPSCRGGPALSYNISKNIWKCPDNSCGKTFSGERQAPSNPTNPPINPPYPPIPTNPPQPKPRWLLPSLLMSALSIIGFGISLYIGTFIPIGMLLTFFIIFSIQRWFGYVTRRYKWAGRGYKLFLNLVILWLCGLIIWSGLKLFSQQFLISPLVGSLVFLSEIIFFIWLCKIQSKHSSQPPSMTLTIFPLLGLFLLFAFAGVQPMASYKDAVVNPVISFFKNSFPPMQELPNPGGTIKKCGNS